jgi:hypothetical protein
MRMRPNRSPAAPRLGEDVGEQFVLELDHRPPADVARVPRRVVAVQRGADERADPVCADEHVGRLRLSILEEYADTPAVILEADAGRAEPNPLGADGVQELRLEVCPMGPEHLPAALVQRNLEQHVPLFRAELHASRLGSARGDLVAHAELFECPEPVSRQGNAGACRFEGLRPLQDKHVMTPLIERKRGSEPADPRSDDDDHHRSASISRSMSSWLVQ